MVVRDEWGSGAPRAAAISAVRTKAEPLIQDAAGGGGLVGLQFERDFPIALWAGEGDDDFEVVAIQRIAARTTNDQSHTGDSSASTLSQSNLRAARTSGPCFARALDLPARRLSRAGRRSTPPGILTVTDH